MASGDQQQHQGLHHEILEPLMDKVRHYRYPSVAMLNMIEESLGTEDVSEYTDLLLEKVRVDHFPSLDQRLQRFA